MAFKKILRSSKQNETSNMPIELIDFCQTCQLDQKIYSFDCGLPRRPVGSRGRLWANWKKKLFIFQAAFLKYVSIEICWKKSIFKNSYSFSPAIA